MRLRCFSTPRCKSHSPSPMTSSLGADWVTGAITILFPKMQQRAAIWGGGGFWILKGHFRASLNAAIALLFNPQLLGLNKQSPSSGACPFALSVVGTVHAAHRPSPQPISGENVKRVSDVYKESSVSDKVQPHQQSPGEFAPQMGRRLDFVGANCRAETEALTAD